MEKPSFVYTIYIQTTPERLWQALTEPVFAKSRSKVTFETGRTLADLEQTTPARLGLTR